ncbi:MAG: CCA tRNA nucleotidyltransferase [Pseudomonadota bacterium]
MEAIKTINIPDWFDDNLKPLMSLLKGDGEEPQSLLVGGCVRNEILKKPVSDIDIATKFTPQEVQKILDKNDIQCIPTGIDHGTVTVILDKKPYEITTLRKDVSTDGRRATIEFSDQWGEDAQRRDFTINALYLDMNGRLYDPLQKGYEDIQDKKVRFIGNADQRIQEDYLRVLRFFRFHSYYGEGDIDRDGLKACIKNREGVLSLSRERITNEFFKILLSDNVTEILEIMFSSDILSKVKSDQYEPNFLKALLTFQSQKNFEPDNMIKALTRYFIISGGRAKFYDDLFTFSKKQSSFLVKLDVMSHKEFYQDERGVKKAMFMHGRELVLQGYTCLLAQDKIQKSSDLENIIFKWDIPEYPITGETLLKEGYKTGPELGQELERRREEWLDENLD